MLLRRFSNSVTLALAGISILFRSRVRLAGERSTREQTQIKCAFKEDSRSLPCRST